MPRRWAPQESLHGVSAVHLLTLFRRESDETTRNTHRIWGGEKMSVFIRCGFDKRSRVWWAVQALDYNVLSFNGDGFVVDNPRSEPDEDVRARILGVAYLHDEETLKHAAKARPRSGAF